jgi:hypothetical protein
MCWACLVPPRRSVGLSVKALWSAVWGKKKESLTGAMVARLPTEQEVVGSIPTLGCGRAGRTYSDFRLLLNSAVRAVANGR